MPYLSASAAVMIHYEEALYQVYAPLPLPLPLPSTTVRLLIACHNATVTSHIGGRWPVSPVGPLRYLFVHFLSTADIGRPVNSRLNTNMVTTIRRRRLVNFFIILFQFNSRYKANGFKKERRKYNEIEIWKTSTHKSKLKQQVTPSKK